MAQTSAWVRRTKLMRLQDHVEQTLEAVRDCLERRLKNTKGSSYETQTSELATVFFFGKWIRGLFEEYSVLMST